MPQYFADSFYFGGHTVVVSLCVIAAQKKFTARGMMDSIMRWEITLAAIPNPASGYKDLENQPERFITILFIWKVWWQ